MVDREAPRLVTLADYIKADREAQSLVTLADITHLRRWGGEPLPFSKSPKRRYVKVKKPVYKDGARVYWGLAPVGEDDDADHQNVDTPFNGFCDFLDKHIIGNIRRRVDSIFGALCGLPKLED